ncbi:MAG: Glutamate racemase [Firmicutes bacterium]|nr:Glutamate racemase [Bacillota bacterium]MDI6706502.1 glutamate racemase [Bacillota bacterium]
MENIDRNLAIGVFDSGVGGISVLADLIRILPEEDFIYLGDCLNIPYGTKDVEEARKLTIAAVEFLLEKGIKALVIACNTATSAAITHLRDWLEIPVVGMEPALKPAVESGEDGSVVVMATPMTLRERKFNSLMEKYRERADIIPLPCPGLVELIEEGKLEGEEVENLLEQLSLPLKDKRISSVVLGCTHYPLIKDAIQRVYGEDVRIIDGNMGTARQLKRLLDKNGLSIDKGRGKGNLQIFTFGDEGKVIPLCRLLLDTMLNRKEDI